VHELAIMESVVDRVAEQLAGERIAAVRLEIGELAGVDVDALRFCFDVCTRDTPLAGSALEILAISGRALCRSCGAEQAMRSLAAPCACGSFDRELTAGDEIRLKDVEVL
jgi:hydrogenase nickel incorporation protein HypA/HybF